MPDRNAVESAIWQWVRAITQLPPERIIWADQNVKQPANPFITLRLPRFSRVGTDGVSYDYDASAPEGQEVIEQVNGLRECTLSVQAFSDAAHGNASAAAMLSKLELSLALPGSKVTLAGGGVTAFDSDGVINVSALAETDFEGRAVLDVRCYVTESVQSRTGYIARSTLTDETGETASTFTVEIPTE